MARTDRRKQQPNHAIDRVSRRDFLKTSAAGAGVAAAGGGSTPAAMAESQPPAGGERESAHFHHVHLNVTDPEKSLWFYPFMFGATKLKFRGVADALFTERSYILLNKVDAPAPTALESGIWHIGWGGVDVPNEFRWWKSQGMDVHTELYPLGRGYVSYWNGPDKEVIELNTQGHHRFSHVHLLAADVNATSQWYTQHLGLRGQPAVPKPKDLSKVRAWSTGFRSDNVSFVVYGQPDYTPRPAWWRWDPLVELKPQAGRVIDHIAFSYRKLEPAFERMQRDGVEIVAPIKRDARFEMKSFFVMAPDKVLIEIVEANPIPEDAWEAR
jgi:catechol 2,3-dioxygenase-like lactoylglutathione lyase family enzyme